MKKIISLGAVAGLFPFLAFAEADAVSILGMVGKILAYLMPILITLAAVWFVWNVIQYTISGDEEKKKKAKSGIIQGLIGLFVIIAFWGIIRIVMKTFDIGTGTYYVPQVPIANTLAE